MYFARISSQNRPANQLQQHLVFLIQKFNHVLLNDPEALLKKIQEDTDRSNHTYKRCTRMDVKVQRESKTQEIKWIAVYNLYNLSIIKVEGQFDLQRVQPLNPHKPAPEPEPEPEPQPAAEPAPTPEPEPVPESRQKLEVWDDRENKRFKRWLYVDTLRPYLQERVQKGLVWGVYHTITNDCYLEEFGGTRHQIFM